MMERHGSRGKKFVTEDEISAELLADTLSDVPDNGDSVSEPSVSSIFIGRGVKCGRRCGSGDIYTGVCWTRAW